HASVVRPTPPPLVESSLHRRGQHPKVDRLAKDLESAQTEDLTPQSVVGCDGDQENRRFRGEGPKLLEHYPSIEPRQFPVQDDQIEGENACPESPRDPEPVGYPLDLVSVATQGLLQDGPDSGIIIDDEHPRRALVPPCLIRLPMQHLQPSRRSSWGK